MTELAVYRECVDTFRTLVARFPQLTRPAQHARFAAYMRKQMDTQGESMPPKDYRILGENLVNMAVRVPASVVGEIDAHVERLRTMNRWAKVGRSEALRDLLLRALDSLTTSPSISLPPIPPAAAPQPAPTGTPPISTASTVAAKHHLGTLCSREHDHEGTGHSLRNASNQCLKCRAEDKRAKDARKRQAKRQEVSA